MSQAFLFQNWLKGPFDNQIHQHQRRGDFHLVEPPRAQCKCSYMGSSPLYMGFCNLADECSRESFVSARP
jgi:hypothetical protein